MIVVVKFTRSEREIVFDIPAVHFDATEKVLLEVGHDHYLPGMHGTFYDIRFRWGPDGEYHPDEAAVTAFFEAEYTFPEENLFAYNETQTKLISEEWRMDTKTMTENPRFAFQDEYDNAEDYAVYGWHRWDQLPGKTSWYLIYRLHTNQNPTNADALGDRTLALWIGDNVYHPATYHSAEKTVANNANLWSIFNYDSQDLASWMWTYQCYSRKEKKYFFYAWTHGKEITVVKENVVHFVPNYYGFFLGKDPWHRSFHGKLMNFNIAFGPGAFKTDGFNDLRLSRVRESKPRESVAGNTYTQDFQENKKYLDVEFDPIEIERL